MNSTLKQLISIVAASSFVLVTQLLTKDGFTLVSRIGIGFLLASMIISSVLILLANDVERKKIVVAEKHLDYAATILLIASSTFFVGFTLILFSVDYVLAAAFGITIVFLYIAIPGLSKRIEENAKDTKERETSTDVIDPETIEETVSSN